MRNLFQKLEFLKTKSFIQFIDSASVPVIKLQMDLTKVHKELLKKLISENPSISSEFEVHDSMKQLGADITFEDQST